MYKFLKIREFAANPKPISHVVKDYRVHELSNNRKDWLLDVSRIAPLKCLNNA